MSTKEEIKSNLENVGGVDKVKVEEKEDGYVFHVIVPYNQHRETKEQLDDLNLGAYNAGSYRPENSKVTPPPKIYKYFVKPSGD